jgi:hypothetical protein
VLVNGTDNLSVVIKRDYFSYFTQRKDITINEMQIYAENASKRHAIDDPATRTTDLHDHQAFTLSLPPDAAGPTQVLTRSASQEVFPFIRYSL